MTIKQLKCKYCIEINDSLSYICGANKGCLCDKIYNTDKCKQVYNEKK